MSAVHFFFQTLPPLLDLDAVLSRSADLYAKYPPAVMLRRVRLDLPRDSPLRLEKGVEELPAKLTNYLDWKRRQRAPHMRNHLQAESSSAPLNGHRPPSPSSAAARRQQLNLLPSAPVRKGWRSRLSSWLQSFSLSSSSGLVLSSASRGASVYSYPAVSASGATLLQFALVTRARAAGELIAAQASYSWNQLRNGFARQKRRRAFLVGGLLLLLVVGVGVAMGPEKGPRQTAMRAWQMMRLLFPVAAAADEAVAVFDPVATLDGDLQR
jgi:hypothetical protein